MNLMSISVEIMESALSNPTCDVIFIQNSLDLTDDRAK